MNRKQKREAKQKTELKAKSLLKKPVLRKQRKQPIVSAHASSIKIVDLPPNSPHEMNQYIRQFEEQHNALKYQADTFQSNYFSLLESIREAILVVDADFAIRQVNTNFIHLSGYPKDEIQGGNFQQLFFQKEDRKKICAAMNQKRGAASVQSSAALELQLIRSDRTIVPVEMRWTQSEAPDTYFIFFHDLSPTKNYERELQQQKKELALLAAISSSMTQPKYLNKDLQSVLESVCTIMGFEQSAVCLGDSRLNNFGPIALVGMTPSETESLLERYFDLISQLKKEKKLIAFNPSSDIFSELFSRPPHCRSIALVPLSIRKNLFGAFAVASVNHIDFDEETKELLATIGQQLSIHIENAMLFKELDAKSREVESINKELSSFVCTVSHDLKTPIIALHGFLNLFKEHHGAGIDDEGNEYLDRVLCNAEYMEKMINDLLKLSRAGHVVGAKCRFSTYKLVNEILMSLYPRLHEKNIQYVVSKKLPVVFGDRNRMQTVFENLIVNAIKYSSPERVPQIEIGCKEKKDSHQFWVKDNGIGIDSENHERIFEVFQKVRQNSDTHEGTGVGLTIVKKIIEHHDGRVWVESKLNRGATFYFTLPKSPTKAKKLK
ncbi:MAG: GAF domain-containing sensor histidine kinase [Candidatus Zhuqueibacterota bacterium]